MKKIAFIIPYFGEFNNYFELFLKSCEYNHTIDFLIFTDNRKEYNYPKNVKVHYMNFQELKAKFQSKIDFRISLERPYKLCDYRPAYGFFFEDYLKGYDFWGFCDTDLIFGNIRKFYTDEMLDRYDKIGIFGHASIIRNDKNINQIFRKTNRYVEVFSSSKNSSLNGGAFDEEFRNSINSLLIGNGYKVYKKEMQANIYTKSSDFRLTQYILDTNEYVIEKKKKSVFVFDHGNLFRYNQETREKIEYLYIHMQARKMKLNISNYDMFKIIPNVFEDVDLDNIANERTKHFNLHYFRLRTKNLFVKIGRRLGHE